MPDIKYRKRFDEGSAEYSLCVWLNAVKHDLTELQNAVGHLEAKAIEILEQGEEMKKKLRSMAREKGEERMDGIEDALEVNPF